MSFFVLDSFPRGSADTEMTEAKGYVQGDALRCRGCGRYVGGLKWLAPYRAELALHGREFGDFVFGGGDDFLVSQNFVTIYRRHGLTGLSGLEPVEIVKVKSRRKKGPEPPPYFHVVVSRSRTAIDLAASGFEWLEPPNCMECRLGDIIRWKRIVIEDGTWTGEDIFIARGLSGTILTSERFKVVCNDNHITNAIFVPAESYGHDFYPGLKDPSELYRPSQ